MGENLQGFRTSEAWLRGAWYLSWKAKFPTSRENGYKLWAQCFLGPFGWTSACYDWSMVFKATISQS